MKTMLSICVLVAGALLAFGADKPSDLTGAGADAFKAHLGKTVILRGRLQQGMQGPCLSSATPTNVVFYIIPEMPTNGTFSYTGPWERLLHKQVRVTGELRFQSFNHANKDPLMQIPGDYYYMVLQQTRIKSMEEK